MRQLLEGTGEAALKQFFEVDNSEPFSPQWKPKPGVVIVPEIDEVVPMGVGLDIANWFTRQNRRRAYKARRQQHPELKPIVSAGDSWFNHPLLSDTVNQLEQAHGYLVFSLDDAGAELKEIVDSGKWQQALTSEGSKTLLISGGGNDLMGDHFGEYLNSGIGRALSGVLDLYDSIIESVKDGFPGVKVFTHSYDFALPRGSGPWLGNKMIEKGITNLVDQRGIIHRVVELFTAELKKREEQNAGRVTYVRRLLNVGMGQWHDEIHPVDAGFSIVGGNFASALQNQGVTP